MSKRFGRNRRRRMREMIVEQARILESLQMHALEVAQERDHLVDVLGEAADIVGKYSAVLPPKPLGVPDVDGDTFMLARMQPRATWAVGHNARVQTARMHMLLVNAWRERGAAGVHCMAELAGHKVAYAVSDEVIASMPRTILASRLSRIIAQQLATLLSTEIVKGRAA